jgi:hypothetical protein
MERETEDIQKEETEVRSRRERVKEETEAEGKRQKERDIGKETNGKRPRVKK